MAKEYPSKAIIQMYAALGLEELERVTGWVWVTKTSRMGMKVRDKNYEWFVLHKHEYDHYGKEFLDSLPVKFFIYR